MYGNGGLMYEMIKLFRILIKKNTLLFLISASRSGRERNKQFLCLPFTLLWYYLLKTFRYVRNGCISVGFHIYI